MENINLELKIRNKITELLDDYELYLDCFLSIDDKRRKNIILHKIQLLEDILKE
jgi:hypothetical protein